MTPAGLIELQADEGFRPAPIYRAFRDTRGNWTIAGGICGAGIGLGTCWTPAQAHAAWVQRVASTESGLRAKLARFAALELAEPVRADVLTNIAFNVGVAGLSRWTTTLAHVFAHEWPEASADLLENAVWEGEVHNRDQRCAHALLTGSWSSVPASTAPPHPDIASAAQGRAA